MLRPLGAIVSIVLICTAAHAGDPADAKAIVEKAIKAMGPEDVQAKHKAHTWKVKGKFTLMGQSLPYTAEYFFQNPDKYRFDAEMELPGQKLHLSVGGAGGKAWQAGMGRVEDMPDAKTKEFNHQIYTHRVSMLRDLRDPAFKLTLMGETKSITGQTHVGVKVSRDGQRDITLFFDKPTGLLARSISRIHDEFSNKEVTQETLISDWKKGSDGVLVIGKITILREDKVFIEEELSDHKFPVKLDERMFSKPAN